LKGEIDRDHVSRLIAGARAAYEDGMVSDCLSRLRKVKFLLDSHRFKVVHLDPLIKRLEEEERKPLTRRKIERCEECSQPLDENAIDGFCIPCLEKIEAEMEASI
jgi:hypothetical protein